MKQVAFLVCICMLTMLLGGCFLETAEGLYAVPKQSEDYYNLQGAIEAAMPNGASYCPPTSGENQQAVQLADLDGDNEDEAIVYLKTTGDLPLAVYVFDKQENSFSLVATKEGSGSAFDHVLYVAVDDAPGYEIVLGRQISGEISQILSVYSMRDGTLVELLNASYSQFITTDLNNNGKQDIFLLRSNEDMQTGVAELYTWSDGQLNREREASASADVSAVKRIITGYMCKDVPAVFVASEYGEGDIITDIYGFRNGVFSNLSKSEDTNTGVQTVRDYYVYSCDIDDDGLIELPHLIELPSISGDENSYDRSLIRWYNLLTNGSEVEKLTTYHNYPAGWYVVIPEEWTQRLVVTRGGQLDGNVGYRFLMQDRTVSELFTIVSISGESAAQTIRQEEWLTLAQKGDVIYACRFGDAAAKYSITLEKLQSLFRFIRVDWKTGETY